MDRLEQIQDYLQPYLVGRMFEKTEAAGMQKDRDRLLPQAADLLLAALKRQEAQPQWQPSYMSLFHLMTGLLTGSHEYELAVSDQQLYLDELRVARFWSPDFLYSDRQGKQNVGSALKEQFVRLNHYEISYAERFVFYSCRSIAGVYWKERLGEITALREFKSLKKARPFRFLFGDYMGEMHTVWEYEEV